MNDAKEEIRDRLNIEDVIGEYLELKRAGRNFKALSPFSNEKTPSFVVSPDKRIWHDFSSGKGGDIFSFIMEVEGLDFKESIKFLAQKAGVELKYYENAKSKKIAQQKERYYKMNKLAIAYYHKTLSANKHALDYVKLKRKFTEETIRKFELGYAPNSQNALVKFLQKRGFNKREIMENGLTNQYSGDLFKSRIMIPLKDSNGKPVGFTGRALSAEMMPKYLNTPSTLLFDKSRYLFALDFAKEMIRKTNCVVLVEGHLDAVSSHQVGITNVVATGGTALTTMHLKMLSRYTSDIRFSFDGDKAGIKATERAIELAQEVGADVKIISIPDSAKDPDELINQSVELWQKAIDDAENAIEWLIKVYKTQFDIKTAQGKRDYSKKMLEIVAKINDPVEKEIYHQKIADTLDISLEALFKQQENIKQKEAKIKTTKKLIKNKDTNVDNYRYQDNLLAIAIINLQVRNLVSEIETNKFETEKRQKLVEFLSQHLDEKNIENWSDLKNLIEYAKVLEFMASESYSKWTNDEQVVQAKRLLDQVKKDHQKNKTEKLIELLREAEEKGDEKEILSVQHQLNQLIKESK